MYIKIVSIVLIATLVISHVETKKNKKHKQEDDSTPQPTVVTYSTFGFNDVVSDGFVPSSPDYLSHIHGYNQDIPTRLYAPAFPSAPDTETNENNSPGTHSEPTYDTDSRHQASMQYQPHLMNFYDASNFDNKGTAFADNNDQAFADSSIVPTYGTKIVGSKVKNYLYPFNHSNHTEKNTNFEPIDQSVNGYPNFHDIQNIKSKPTYMNQEYSSNTNVNYYVGSYSAPDVSQQTRNTGDSLKFPKFIDFTKINQNSPLELNTKYGMDVKNEVNIQNELIHSNIYEDQKYKKNVKPVESKKYGYNNNDENIDNTKLNNFYNQPSVQNYISNSVDSTKTDPNYRNKLSTKPLISNNKYNIWKNSEGSEFKNNYDENRYKQKYIEKIKKINSSIDEVIPESSNNIDIATSSLTDIDYSTFKKIPGVRAHYEDDFTKYIEDDPDNDNYIKQLKKLYAPSTSSSQWGNLFKHTDEDYSSSNQLSKPYITEDVNSDIVHIPKKNFLNSFKSDTKENDWGFYSKSKPYKNSIYDWNKNVINNRFKSEEDLLGLRNHYSYSSLHLPSYKPIEDDISSADYKKIADKWKLSYLKAKYKDYSNNFESHTPGDRPVHVPVPKPYPIEIPRPVIVAVPQPYPVRVPVPKPIAVPVVREIKVPVEKPVPYPVYKKVPYPIEKPVMIPVEKQVPVPVIKPYPVVVPKVRPVFHHSRHKDEFEDDGYEPRPESSELRDSKRYAPHFKRPWSSRGKARRPAAAQAGPRLRPRPRRPARGEPSAEGRRAAPPCDRAPRHRC